MKKSTRDAIYDIINSNDNAWLGVEPEDVDGFKNPLDDLTPDQKDNLHLHVISIRLGQHRELLILTLKL